MNSLKEGRLRDIYLPGIVFFLVIFVGIVAAAEVSKNLFVAVTVSNTAPFVYNVTNSTVTLTDGSTTQVLFKFNVTDVDGRDNLDNTSAQINVSLNGLYHFNGTTCMSRDINATSRVYECAIVFQYWDNSSTIWWVNASIKDSAGAFGTYNTITGTFKNNVTVNSLSAFTLQTPAVVVSANMGDTNKELTIVVNNTGNFDFTLINVTPTDLNASLTDVFRLESNFSINATASSANGFGEGIKNGTPRNFSDSALDPPSTSATLPHHIVGGVSNGAGELKGNRTLYIYVDVPSSGLSSGVTYNASPVYPWQIVMT